MPSHLQELPKPLVAPSQIGQPRDHGIQSSDANVLHLHSQKKVLHLRARDYDAGHGRRGRKNTGAHHASERVQGEARSLGLRVAVDERAPGHVSLLRHFAEQLVCLAQAS